VSGHLILVATPIGNLGDLSPRAVTVLAEADVVLCEDTRRTRQLLSAVGIPGGGRLRSLHEHNEEVMRGRILEELVAGATAALVSDAGMPAISDPGQLLVAAAASAGIEVTVVPGPSAVLAALVVSGLATDRFVMEGFLPRRGRDRTAAIEGLGAEERTVVVFEAPTRVPALMADLARHLGDLRRVAVARELTKIHEEVWRGTLGEAAARWAAIEARGEHVIVLEGAAPAAPAPPADEEVLAFLTRAIAAGATKRDAALAACSDLGIARRRAYALANTLG
jgi:16S rRNA (cytidine1402-2'-O)-methyltransferase